MEALKDLNSIEKLLQTTGWSCEELLSKLQEYKSKEIPNNEGEKQSTSCQNEENQNVDNEKNKISEETEIKEKADESPVILETIKFPTSTNGEISPENGGSDENDEATTETVVMIQNTDEEILICDGKRNEDDCETPPEPSINSSQELAENIESSKSPTRIPSPEIDSEARKTEEKPEDNIRNFLKQQLSSLRTKKKTENCFAELPKKPTEVFHNLKKKRKSEAAFMTGIDEDEPKNKKPNNTLISLTDETQFLILDVTGGVDRVEELPQKPEETFEGSESSQSAISCEIREMQKRRTFRSSHEDHSDSSNNKLIPSEEAPSTSATSTSNRPFNLFRKRTTSSSHDEDYATVTPIVPKIEIEENPLIPESPQPANKISVKSFAAGKEESAPLVSSSQIVGSANNAKKSPFISDSLDEFLTTKSQLNISYSIPKLGAEEGIKEITEQSPYDYNPTPVTNYRRVTKRKGQTKLIKAKTVAQMRRQLEKLHKQKKMENIKCKNNEHFYNNGAMSIKKNNIQLKKVSENESNLLEHLGRSQSPLRIASIDRNGCIIFNNQVLRVSLKKKTTKSLLQIKDDFARPIKKIPNRRASSLLATLHKSNVATNRVQYRPGPLCMKPFLQSDISSTLWTTKLKKLPQVFIEVQPQIGKPINPQFVHLLPVFDDPVLTPERVNFALSTLQTNKDPVLNTETFKFPVAYDKKQEHIIVATNRLKTEPSPDKSAVKTDSDVTVEVQSVIDNLLNYVEIKEISESLVKEDDPPESPEPKEELDPDETAKKQLKKKKPSFYLELLRLNCKFIDIANHEEGHEVCGKPHCRLGCVCKSLCCDQIYSNHCQLVECMFKCTCPPPLNEVLTSKNKVSDLNVNHLDDHAKRNLAKVERDFTQTIIKTDNDTILVGSSRSKARRATKVPKKYTDYDSAKRESPVIKIEPSGTELKPCGVNLTRYDMSDIVPLCLGHGEYDCAICHIPVIDYWSRIKRESAHLHKSERDNCARSRPIFSQYAIRNKNAVYQEKLRKKYTILQITKSSDVDAMIIDVDEKKPSKRKQVLETRDFSDFIFGKQYEYAMQRRKQKPKPFVTPKTYGNKNTNKGNQSVDKAAAKKVSSYVAIFPGEMKLSLHDNPEALKIVGKNNIDQDYVRILPWDNLIRGFREGSINIWAMMDRPSVLLCNIRHKDAPKNFIDIRLIDSPSEITTWIIRNILPADKPKHSSYVILKPTKNHFIISGFCVRNSDKSPAAREGTNDDFKASDILRIDEPKVERNLQTALPSKTTLKCVHKDMNNSLKILVLSNKLFELRSLYGENTQFQLSLPRIPQSCRWRMIYLNSDFTFLRFRASEYSIKYTDLMDAVQTAKNYAKTITLRNSDFTSKYKHPIFGVFLVPQHQDRLFVGPFLSDEDHNIETLRYMRGALVDTCVFHEAQGIVAFKKSIWLSEANSDTLTQPIDDVLIDITQDDDDTNAQDGIDSNAAETEFSEDDNDMQDDSEMFHEHLFRPPFVQPFIFRNNMHSSYVKKVNRYVSTNIPHLGYLEAYQHDNKKTLDVFFSFANRGYRFHSASFASESLVQYFSQIFFPVPANFKIVVLIQTQISPNHKLMHPSYFSRVERHICGEFGVYNEKNVPRDVLTRYGVLSIDSFFNFKQQSDRNSDNIVRLFGQFMMYPDKFREAGNDPGDILVWAKDEISRLTKATWDHETISTGLENLIKLKLQKIQGLLATVPHEERLKYNKELAKIRRVRRNRVQPLQGTVAPPKKLETGITIEIDDSDDEAPSSEKAEASTSPEIGFKKISTSGRIQGGSKERSVLKSNVFTYLSNISRKRAPDNTTSEQRVKFDHTFKLVKKVIPATITSQNVI